MPRRVFFSFHYERDISRACVVRNSWLCHSDREAAGFWDASLWESAKLTGHAAVKRLIDDGLLNTSVTVVLIGAETAGRSWVQYEIKESLTRGNGLLGIYIHRIRNLSGLSDRQGHNPFDLFTVNRNGWATRLSSIVPVYDWVLSDGYANIGSWVEEAARRAGH